MVAATQASAVRAGAAVDCAVCPLLHRVVGAASGGRRTLTIARVGDRGVPFTPTGQPQTHHVVTQSHASTRDTDLGPEGAVFPLLDGVVCARPRFGIAAAVARIGQGQGAIAARRRSGTISLSAQIHTCSGATDSGQRGAIDAGLHLGVVTLTGLGIARSVARMGDCYGAITPSRGRLAMDISAQVGRLYTLTVATHTPQRPTVLANLDGREIAGAAGRNTSARSEVGDGDRSVAPSGRGIADDIYASLARRLAGTRDAIHVLGGAIESRLDLRIVTVARVGQAPFAAIDDRHRAVAKGTGRADRSAARISRTAVLWTFDLSLVPFADAISTCRQGIDVVTGRAIWVGIDVSVGPRHVGRALVSRLFTAGDEKTRHPEPDAVAQRTF